MARVKETNDIIVVQPISTETIKIRIEGTTDLVLNKITKRAADDLQLWLSKNPKNTEPENYWESRITSLHWRDPVDSVYTEEAFYELLKHNAPCISAFGLKQSFGDAVVRNNIETYATRIKNAINIEAPNNLVPIKFAGHFIDTTLMSPPGKRGSKVMVTLHRFSGWSAEFTVSFLTMNYTRDSIINIIRLAGFGLGIGSGRSSGYGRYNVTDVFSM